MYPPIIDLDTAVAILSHHGGLRNWPQPFTFPTPHGDVDVTVAIGEKAQTPDNVSEYQPAVYPSWQYHKPVYRFDPWYYCGKNAQQSLMSDIRKSLVDVNFFSNQVRDRDLYTNICLICSFSKILSKNTHCRDECSIQIGIPVEPTKIRGSITFDRLDHSKWGKECC